MVTDVTHTHILGEHAQRAPQQGRTLARGGPMEGFLPGELGHSLQEPGGVAVQRHGACGGLEASRCAELSDPLFDPHSLDPPPAPHMKNPTCDSAELT